MEQQLNKIDRQKLIDILKIVTNIFLIICFLVGSYYYIAHTTEVNEAMSFESPTKLISLYENKTGEVCVCTIGIKEMFIKP